MFAPDLVLDKLGNANCTVLRMSPAHILKYPMYHRKREACHDPTGEESLCEGENNQLAQGSPERATGNLFGFIGQPFPFRLRGLPCGECECSCHGEGGTKSQRKAEHPCSGEGAMRGERRELLVQQAGRALGAAKA